MSGRAEKRARTRKVVFNHGSIIFSGSGKRKTQSFETLAPPPIAASHVPLSARTTMNRRHASIITKRGYEEGRNVPARAPSGAAASSLEIEKKREKPPSICPLSPPAHSAPRIPLFLSTHLGDDRAHGGAGREGSGHCESFFFEVVKGKRDLVFFEL